VIMTAQSLIVVVESLSTIEAVETSMPAVALVIEKTTHANKIDLTRKGCLSHPLNVSNYFISFFWGWFPSHLLISLQVRLTTLSEILDCVALCHTHSVGSLLSCACYLSHLRTACLSGNRVTHIFAPYFFDLPSIASLV
jgi:hypothetical protein